MDLLTYSLEVEEDAPAFEATAEPFRPELQAA